MQTDLEIFSTTHLYPPLFTVRLRAAAVRYHHPHPGRVPQQNLVYFVTIHKIFNTAKANF